MKNKHAIYKQTARDKKRGQGMVRKELWVWPETWPEILAFANAKTDKRELIKSCDEPIAKRCERTIDAFDDNGEVKQ